MNDFILLDRYKKLDEYEQYITGKAMHACLMGITKVIDECNTKAEKIILLKNNGMFTLRA